MPTEAPSPDSFPGDDVIVFDLAQALRVVGDDREILVEIIDVFVEDLARMMKAIEDAFSKGNLGDIELHAHSLKGASANVGGQRVRAVAGAIEQAGRSSNLEAANALWPALIREAEAFEKHLRGLDPETL